MHSLRIIDVLYLLKYKGNKNKIRATHKFFRLRNHNFIPMIGIKFQSKLPQLYFPFWSMFSILYMIYRNTLNFWNIYKNVLIIIVATAAVVRTFIILLLLLLLPLNYYYY